MPADFDFRLFSAFIAAEGAVVAIAVAVLNQLSGTRARRLSLISYYDSRDAIIREWASKVVTEIDSAIVLFEQRCENPICAVACSARTTAKRNLSSFADIGRWFFPNENPDSFGVYKEEAYRGFRPRVLDAVVGSYSLIDEFTCDDGDGHRAVVDGLVKQKRLFVAEVQRSLNPRSAKEIAATSETSMLTG